MFDRFTDEARKVMARTRKEAQRFGHDFIDTEHMLLGLIQARTRIAGNALVKLGVETDKLRADIERSIRPDSANITMGQIPFTPKAKRVLEFAVEEADESGHPHIGAEHLLIGLHREAEGIAGQAMARAAIDLEALRQTVRELTALLAKVIAEVEAKYSEALKTAGFWSRIVLSIRMRREIRRATERILAP